MCGGGGVCCEGVSAVRGVCCEVAGAVRRCVRGGGRVGCMAALGSRQARVQLRLAAGSPGHRSPPRAPANSSVSGAVTEAALWCPPEHEMIYVQRSEQGRLSVRSSSAVTCRESQAPGLRSELPEWL